MATHLAISPARFEAECRALYHEVEAITNGLSKAQFNWQPDGGRRWSIAQCLDHLTKGNLVYVAPLEQAIARATPRQGREPGVPNGFARWFIGQLEPPVRTRMKAPSKIIPGTDLDPVEARQAFDASVDRVKELLDRAWTIELSRTRFWNPFIHLPVFNVASAFLISLAHMRRHIAQAGAVRSHPDFPV
ncbi:MAG: DinB family protein [Acidobacteria bacterium]|nr:MAG: DinB family protein [Acidobacteriota bacterium]